MSFPMKQNRKVISHEVKDLGKYLLRAHLGHCRHFAFPWHQHHDRLEAHRRHHRRED